MRVAWICEGCGKSNESSSDIWCCPTCKKETCEQCFSTYAHCAACSVSLGEDKAKEAANKEGWEF